MIYTIGAYTLNPQKPFKTMDEVVKFTQERHPELSKEVIEKYINPKITEKNEPDKSGGIHQETKESGKTTSKANKGGDKSEGSAEDQPG